MRFLRLAVLLALTGAVWGEPPAAKFQDLPWDTVARPMDPGASLPFDTWTHRLPDLRAVTIGAWAPDDPIADPFAGAFAASADFVRIDLSFEGLVNPPGDVDPWHFEPFRYGPHSVFGFVEIDMDGDVNTGGELDAPLYRYLGNVARFGGNVSRPEIRDRVALDASAFDGDFLSTPWVERSGEEFHLALLGDQFGPADIEVVEGDEDLVFEIGETWDLRGSFFHRAHGFEPFSFVEGGRYPGEYMPLSDLRFHHDSAQNLTYVSLVFPLTHIGAGLMRGEPPEPINQDPTDQASVLEALQDLQLSAFFLPIIGTGIPEEDIILNWAERDPEQHLDPAAWSITAILGSSYTAPSPQGAYFLWSDVYPNVVLGDVDGSGTFDGRDRQLIAEYIARRDAADGAHDGVVTIRDFATDFSVYDVNYDGRVDAFDLVPEIPDGDGDRDGDLDLFDFAILQRCFGGGVRVSPECLPMDLTRDLTIDLADWAEFHLRFDGPRG